MAHLARNKRCDLITLATELNLEVPEKATKSQIVTIITKSDTYDDELATNILEGVISEREEIEFRATEVEKREFELKKIRNRINFKKCSGRKNI